MVAIGAAALKQKGMGPRPPVLFGVQMTLGAANRAVNQRSAAGKANATRPRVAFKKLTIGQTIEANDFTCDWVALHEYSPLLRTGHWSTMRPRTVSCQGGASAAPPFRFGLARERRAPGLHI